MKVLVILALVAVAAARSVEEASSNTAFGYHKNIGRPLAAEIEKAEAELANGGRIINGNLASPGQFPFQAGLLASFSGTTGRGVCGASLVSQRSLFTAAHCWSDGQEQAIAFEVVLGSVFLFNGGTRITTRNVVMHPGYVALRALNDVAVITLENKVSLSSTIAPIALPTGAQLSETFANEVGIASGFGLTSNSGSISTNQGLSYVELNIITNSVCFWSFPLFVQSSNICTAGTSSAGIVSTCRGDSGGPLTVERNYVKILTGITSFGSGLGCEVGSPAAFARVTSFIDFFNQHIIRD